MPTTLRQKKNYLDILAVFHYVNGGLIALFTLGVLAFLGIGLGAATGWGNDWEPEAGCSIVAIMAFAFVFAGGYAVLNLLAGRALQTRNHTVLVMITSGINCLNMPLGTLLGIFTLVMVSDPEVRWLFDYGDEAAATAAATTAPATTAPTTPRRRPQEPPAPPVE